MKLGDALKLLAIIESEEDSLKNQKKGDEEQLPPIHIKLFGRRKRFEITVVDEDK